VTALIIATPYFIIGALVGSIVTFVAMKWRKL